MTRQGHSKMLYRHTLSERALFPIQNRTFILKRAFNLKWYDNFLVANTARLLRLQSH